MKKNLASFLAVLMFAGTGCAVVQSPSNTQAGSGDSITDEAYLPYPISYVYERWSIIQSKDADKVIVRPVEYFDIGAIPYSRTTFEYDSKTGGSTKIFRAYQSDGKHFSYCIEECNVTINLEAVSDSKTKATIKYFNYQGDPTPFAEEMRAGLQKFLAE